MSPRPKRSPKAVAREPFAGPLPSGLILLGCLAGLCLLLGLAFGLHFHAPFSYYPTHAFLAALWVFLLAALFAVVPRAGRPLLWPLLFGLAVQTALAVYAVAALSRTLWGVNVDRHVVLSFADQAVDFVGAIGRTRGQVYAAAVLPGLLAALASGLWLRRRTPELPRFPRPLVAALVLLNGLVLADGARHAGARALPARVWQWDPLASLFYTGRVSAMRDSEARAAARARDAAARAEYPAAAPTRRHIILFAVDACRPDHLPFYGYGRDTAPFWSSLKSRGHWAQVDRAYSSAAESVGGLTAMMIPRWPRATGPEAFGLPEALQRQGFRTRFFLSGIHDWFGLTDAYGRPQQYFSGEERGGRAMDDDRSTLAALESLPPDDGGRDFIMIHLLAVHQVGLEEARFRRWKPVENWIRLTTFVRGGGLSPEQARGLVNDYDNRILQADDEIRRAFAILGAKGYLKDAVVALLADHGQSLGENGIWGHCFFVTQPILRVPLTFWSDRPLSVQAGRLASIIDVAPTLLAEAGLPAPSSWDGRALRAGTRPRTLVAAEDVMHDRRWGGLVWDSPWGTLKYERFGLRGAEPETEFLYQLDRDPGEVRDVMATAPASTREAVRRLAGLYLSP